ncbi:histone H1A, sperm-like [Centruroides sculpturatus]|uniref:histone H1A, sperm-like n=1 Tax=Centruroides sculpturatus TaxID=218467 RepID=UPI000C6CC3BB|nr:histone H1A, sperm-like [Centruroides sculpturatus]
MTDTAEASESPKVTKSPKKTVKTAARAKKPKTASSHPKVSVMVEAAISNLKERRGSSLPAIKKYIAANYKVDMTRLSPFVKKYLKTAVANGSLLQTKGKGASGSFKLNTGSSKADKPAKAKVVKKAAPAVKVPKKKATTVAKKPKPKATKAEKKTKPVKSATKKPKSKPVAKPKPKKAAKTPTKKAAAKKGKK